MNARWLRMLALLFAGGLFVQSVAVCPLSAAERATTGGTGKNKQRSIVPGDVFDDLTLGPAERKKFEETKAKAEKGDAEAQSLLGFMYYDGRGVQKDYAEATKWYRRAAEQGDSDAQWTLGTMYEMGKGVQKDNAEAVKWYRKSAEQGQSYAAWNLGEMYEHGRGVEKDHASAIKWYRKAAEADGTRAYYLGEKYQEGKIVPQDYTEAAKWYRKAAEQNDDPFARFAEYKLGWMYANGKGVEKDDTEAVKWFRKAAEGKFAMADAQVVMGQKYFFGLGVQRNYDQAYEFYRKAAEQGDEDGRKGVADCLLSGLGVPADFSAAFKIHEEFARRGDMGSQQSLAVMYEEGKGVPQDFVEAYKWWNLAASGDLPPPVQKHIAQRRDALAERMTASQIAEAQRLSREFKPRKTPNAGSDSSPAGIVASQPASSGTGFFISEDGYLVTNHHVVKDGNQVRVLTASGLVSARVVKVDAGNDLAVLKAEGKFAALPVASSRSVKLGATVATVGFPNVGLQGFSPKVAKGEIGSLAGAQDDSRHFQISAAIQPGNSGGALVDERGNVIGVVVAKLSQKAALATSGTLAENVNYAVKSSYLLSFLESLPEVAAKLKEPNTKDRKFEDVVKDVERATVLVLVY